VFDITGSEFDALPKSRLVHTETYDAFNEELDMETGEFSFQLVSHIAQGRRLRIVIYIGDRYIYYNSECNCEYVEYDHDCDGVQDLVGNRTQIVEEQYTIWGSSCSGGGDGDGSGDVTIQAGNGSGNPFDPWAGGSITFNLNGFDGGGAVSVEVFDVAGVKVADLSPGNISSTVGTVNWNGRNEDGEYVAQGVYLVHFASQGGQASGATSQVLKVVVKRGSTASN
jgi:FlgD Ig-like domain